MRDMDKNPYSKDEARVAKFFFERGLGGGDDPIGALIASHEFLISERKGNKVEVEMSATGYANHVYPSAHGPGTFWATDEAWAILDRIRPGVIPNAARAWLSGMIAGSLVRISEEGKPDESRSSKA